MVVDFNSNFSFNIQEKSIGGKEEHGVNFVKEMQRIDETDDIEEKKKSNGLDTRRKTIHNIMNNRTQTPTITNLEVSFKKRLQSISAQGEGSEVNNKRRKLNKNTRKIQFV